MSNENRIDAEVRLDHKSVDVGVTSIVGQMGRLDKAVENASSRIERDLSRSLSGLGGQVRNVNFDRLASQLNSLPGGRDLFGGIDAQKDVLGKIAQSGQQALTEIARVGSGFRAEIAQISTLVPSLKGDKLEEFAENLRTIGRELGVGVDATQAAVGAYAVLQNGFENAADAQVVLANALKTGIAGRATDTKAAIDLITGTLNAFNLTAKDSEALGDKIFTAIEKGGQDLDVDTLARTLGRVSGNAHSAGVSIDEMFAVLATATSKGVQLGTAIDGLNGLIQAIQKPTDEAKKEFQALGVQVDAASLKNKGLLKVLREVNEALAKRGNAGSLTRIGGEQSSRNLLANLTGSANFSKLEENVKASQESAGRQAKVLEAVGTTSEAAFNRMTAAGERFKVGMEASIEPSLVKFADAAAHALDAVDKIPAPVKAITLAVVGLATAVSTVGVAALFVAGSIAAALRQLALFRGARGAAMVTQVASVGTEITQASKDFMAFKYASNFSSGRSGGGLAATRTVPLPGGSFAGQVGGEGAAAATGWRAAASAVGEYVAASSAVSVGLVGAGAVILGIGAAWAQAEIDLMGYNLELQKADRLESELFGDGVTNGRSGNRVRTQDAITLDNEFLAEQGFTGKDLRAQLAEDRNRISTLNEQAGNAATLEESQKAKAEADLLRSNLDAMEKKANELDAYLKNRDFQNSPEGKMERQRSLDETFKIKFQEIQLDRKSHEEKLARLRELRSLVESDLDKRLQVEREIFQEEEKLDKEREEKRKKKAADKLKNQLQNVDNSTDSEVKKLTELRKLAAAYKDQEEPRRAIEDRIFKYEQKLNQKREEAIKKLADLREQAAQIDEQRSQNRQSELERLSGRGVDTFDAQVDELANQGRSRAKQIDDSLAADLAKEKDPEVIKARKELATQQHLDNQADFDRKGAELLRQDKAQRLQAGQEELQIEQRIADQKIGIYQQMLATGKNVEAKLAEAVKARLALVEEEIALRAELAQSQTDDPRRIALIEQEAQGQILAARKAATDEIARGTEALKAQKAAKDRLNGGEFSGKIMSLDQFVQNENERFKFKEPGWSKPPATFGIDLKGAEQAVLQSERVSKEQGKAQAQVIPVNGRFEIVLLDKEGKPIPHEFRKVEINGKSSETAKLRGGYPGL